MSVYMILCFDQFNEVFGVVIGWILVGVEGLLLELDFFDYLVNCCFLVIWWICCLDQIDYIVELDLFYDLFGYVLLLMNLVFVDYMEVYGRGGVKVYVIGLDVLQNLICLYWYIVEFGLIDMFEGLCIYGVGIVLLKGELLYLLELVVFNCIGFDLQWIMCMKYCIDIFQKIYFVIDSFEQLMQVMLLDFILIYVVLVNQVYLLVGDVQGDDCVFQKGMGEGWVDGGDV